MSLWNSYTGTPYFIFKCLDERDHQWFYAFPVALRAPEDLSHGKILLATVAQRIVKISLILDLKQLEIQPRTWQHPSTCPSLSRLFMQEGVSGMAWLSCIGEGEPSNVRTMWLADIKKLPKPMTSPSPAGLHSILHHHATKLVIRPLCQGIREVLILIIFVQSLTKWMLSLEEHKLYSMTKEWGGAS